MEFTAAGKKSTVMLDLPLKDGSFKRFRIVESPISAGGNQRQSDFQSYSGQGVDDPNTTMRFSWASNGFHAFILTPQEGFVIEPAGSGNTGDYVVHSMKDEAFRGKVSYVFEKGTKVELAAHTQQTTSNGTELRIYRTAVAASFQYIQQNGGTPAAALTNIKTTMMGVNAIYERELSIRLQLLSDADELRIFATGDGDYTDSNTEAMLVQNQTRLTQILGNNAYDVGHAFGVTGAFSGVASLACACGDNKARGVSTMTPNQPARTTSVIGVVHEFGHQFSAPHTYDGVAGPCRDQKDATSAFEPGSGSTMMAYPGVCTTDNLQATWDPYFHYSTLEVILAHVDTNANKSCGTRTATGNRPPTVNAGGTFTIPPSTPFMLTGSGNDADNDTVNYTWEQSDAGTPPATGALFRSYSPTTSPTRIFPSPRYIASNGNTPPTHYLAPQINHPNGTYTPAQTFVVGETLPTTNRTMSFRLTGRDGRAQGGIGMASTTITVQNSGGAFLVTAPADNAEFPPGTAINVTWNVSGTAAAPFNAANVRITLSSDGGLTFPTELAASVPNNGTANVTLPNTPNGKARIRVEAIGNIFFSVSGAFFIRQPCNGLSLTPASLPDGGQYMTYAPQNFMVTGGTAPITFKIAGGTLPVNVTLTTAGVLSGGPQNSGTFNFTVMATDSVGCSVQNAYTLRVLPEANAGDAGGQVPSMTPLRGGGTLAARNVAGIPINVPVTLSGPFPSPVTVNYTTVNGTAVAGTNYTATAGTLTFMPGETSKAITVMAMGATAGGPVDKFKVVLSSPSNTIIDDAEGEVDLIETDTAGCAQFTFNPAALPAGKVGVAYSQPLTGSGNTSPLIHFAITDGALPEGLDLNEATGTISGTPEQSGTFTVEFAALDQNYCDGDRTYTLVINPGAPVIYEFSPDEAENNTVIEIHGTGFTGATSVKFGGVEAALTAAKNLNAAGFSRATKATAPGFTVNSDNLITATTPADFPTGLISVTTPSGTAQSSAPLVHINDRPLANDATFSTNKNTSVSGRLGGSDANNEKLSFAIIGNEMRGQGVAIMNNAATGDFTFTPKPGFAGTAHFFFTVTDANVDSELAEVTINVLDNSSTASLSDPLACTGQGNRVQATLNINNNTNVSQNVVNTTTFTNLVGIPGSCVVTPNVGTCTVTNTGLSYTGTLTAGTTVVITYLTQVRDTAPTGAQVCTINNATFNGVPATTVTACATINCPLPGPGLPFPAAAEAGDQGAGSVLIYNVYTSGATSGNTQNTRLNLTNSHPTRQAFVHLFFVSESCSVADSYVCLTANQTTSFLASDLDPGVTGYLVAVAVDEVRGCPTSHNFLLGDEYVKFSTGHAANLGAEAYSQLAGGLPACDDNSVTAQLNFDGVSYDRVSHVLADDSVGSRADGNDRLLILNRIGGNLGTGAGSLGSIFGIFYDDTESGVSFTFSGGHQFRSSLSNSFPRITPRFETFIPSGRTGWYKLWPATPGVEWGMTGAAINFNPNTASGSGAFNQGRNLHKLRLTNQASYIIPVFPPSC
ncbi:MAG TPA: M12 family metallo-peptidase [Blastocatellia bacterium]|nr:M12 family metallo-peptidase [Blastocatellia bacterium]HMX26196.1 M12 family metallo-peptidase [Blastocatellia bacterium]HMY73237.1 M12 family metallo-peptidase [Blastocatellia bacterium]HMZ20292.1 M12 family metallo-peptidase [Blastocatellia bacterium]HNG32931.1 M12 family metallo-peptidase [Blastocatellia bacterium]